jgi:uncharacterized membrane protein
MKIRELRAEARESLKGNYFKIVWPLFIVYLISFACSYLYQNYLYGDMNGAGYLLSTFIYSILVAAITIPLWYGIIITVIKVARKEEVNFLSDTIANYKNAYYLFWNLLIKLFPFYILLIFSALLYFGGFYLLNINKNYIILIGVSYFMYMASAIVLAIKALQYSLAYYLKYDYNNKDTKELFEKSKMLMKGNVSKMFVLPFTFVGWFILAIIPSSIAISIFDRIWAPIIQGERYISTAPLWAQGIEGLIIAFVISFVIAYFQMTMYHFYMEQNPLKIYEEGYVKPETNSKKYIWIMSIILSICILLIIFGIVIVFLAASLLPTM